MCDMFSIDSLRIWNEFQAERRLDSGECLVEFLPPVDPSGFESVDDLSNHCRNLMMLKHEELNKELRDKSYKKQN